MQQQGIAGSNVITLGEQTRIFQYYPSAVPCIPDMFQEYVGDDTGWNFLPYKHLRFYHHQQYLGGSVQYIWSCRYCSFWCDAFDTDIMNLHLCRRCVKISHEDREQLRISTYERLKLQLSDIFDVVLIISPIVIM